MTTTVGVHRDDIAITIDGREARTFASQGQQRSAVLRSSWLSSNGPGRKAAKRRF